MSLNIELSAANCLKKINSFEEIAKDVNLETITELFCNKHNTRAVKQLESLTKVAVY